MEQVQVRPVQQRQDAADLIMNAPRAPLGPLQPQVQQTQDAAQGANAATGPVQQPAIPAQAPAQVEPPAGPVGGGVAADQAAAGAPPVARQAAGEPQAAALAQVGGLVPQAVAPGIAHVDPVPTQTQQVAAPPVQAVAQTVGTKQAITHKHGTLYYDYQVEVPKAAYYQWKDQWKKPLKDKLRSLSLMTFSNIYMAADREGDPLKPTIVIICNSESDVESINLSLKNRKRGYFGLRDPTGLKSLRKSCESEGVSIMVLLDEKMGSKGMMSPHSWGNEGQPGLIELEISVSHWGANVYSGNLLRVSQNHSLFASLGGLVVANGELYGLTVGHVFADLVGRPRKWPNRSNVNGRSAPQEGLIEDSDSDLDEEPEGEDEIFAKNAQRRDYKLKGFLHSIGWGRDRYLPGGEADWYTQAPQRLLNADWGLSSLTTGVDETSHLSFNVAAQGDLIDTIEPEHRLAASYGKDPLDVTVCTASGGYVSGSLGQNEGDFNLNGHLFEARQIFLKRSLGMLLQKSFLHGHIIEYFASNSILIVLVVQGDSGSWVIKNNSLCGIIIGGGGRFPWAFMLPIQQVQDDIRASLGHKMEFNLPSRDELDRWRRGLPLRTTTSSDILLSPTQKLQTGGPEKVSSGKETDLIKPSAGPSYGDTPEAVASASKGAASPIQQNVPKPVIDRQEMGWAEQRIYFCQIVGLDSEYMYRLSKDTGVLRREPRYSPGGFCRRVEDAYRLQSIVYWVFTMTINIGYLLIVAMGATIAGLGATDTSPIAVAVLGGFVAVLGGVESYFKGRGQPNRARQARNDLKKVLEFALFAEMELSSPVPIPGRDAEWYIHEMRRLYDAAQQNMETNFPDVWTSISALGPQVRGKDVEAVASRPGMASKYDDSPGILGVDVSAQSWRHP